MKKTLCIFTVLLLVLACNKKIVEKPQHLVSEEEMTNILYDMALLQSMKSYNNANMDSLGINSRNYIFKKYGIDSLTLVQNHTYYAADLEGYEKIQRSVKERLEQEKQKNETGPTTPNITTGGNKPAEPVNEANRNRQLPLNDISRK